MAEKEFEGEEFVFPDEQEVTPVGKTTPAETEVRVEADADTGEIEIEIEDDTPPEDRGREPLPEEMVKELEKDEGDDYSHRVKERMSQLKKVWHDERRAKEAAAREREEAIRYAQALMEENKRLKTTLSSGEKTYVEVAKQAAEHELNLAKRAYREAYDTGDVDRQIEAQQLMNQAQYKLTQMQNYEPQYEKALQDEENPVYIQPQQQNAYRPEPKALNWQEKNPWFGQDEEMTSLALGLHEKLVRGGVDPTSDDYYRRIDSTMRKRFPEYFEEPSLDEEPKPAQRAKPSNVVAPATRSTAPKKVRLTASASSIVKKLGISPEQYAKELAKLESK
jgi:hypothetical protein